MREDFRSDTSADWRKIPEVDPLVDYPEFVGGYIISTLAAVVAVGWSVDEKPCLPPRKQGWSSQIETRHERASVRACVIHPRRDVSSGYVAAESCETIKCCRCRWPTETNIR